MTRLWSGQLKNHSSIRERSKRFFCYLHTPVHWVLGILYIMVKQLGCETDYSVPSSATIKNKWCYTSTPQYAFVVYLRITLPLYIL